MTTRQTFRLIGGAVVAAIAMSSHGALADVIDGNWCYRDGRHFAIRGADIVTPAGTAAKGNWSRHSFSYEVPSAEADAGKTIYMLLQDENTLVLAVGTQPMISDPAKVQIWHRCADQVSQLRR